MKMGIMAERKEIECRITGKVQMVLFRDFVQRKARSLGVVGQVRNANGGSVYVVAQGAEEDLEKLVSHLHKGPFMARVANVKVRWRNPQEKFLDFKIVY